MAVVVAVVVVVVVLKLLLLLRCLGVIHTSAMPVRVVVGRTVGRNDGE